MEEKPNLFESILERAEEYTRTSIELVKLKTVDKISDLVSTAVSRAIAWIFFILFFLMGSVGLALWLGDRLGRPFYGFLLLSAFFGIIGTVIYFIMHKPIKKTVGDNIIEELLK